MDFPVPLNVSSQIWCSDKIFDFVWTWVSPKKRDTEHVIDPKLFQCVFLWFTWKIQCNAIYVNNKSGTDRPRTDRILQMFAWKYGNWFAFVISIDQCGWENFTIEQTKNGHQRLIEDIDQCRSKHNNPTIATIRTPIRMKWIVIRCWRWHHSEMCTLWTNCQVDILIRLVPMNERRQVKTPKFCGKKKKDKKNKFIFFRWIQFQVFC